MRINKLILLNRRQWMENKRSYYIGMTAITGILLFLFLITWHFRDSFAGDVNRGIFLLGLFIGGGLFAASLFRDINKPSKGIWFIGIPASAAEKLFVAVLHGAVLYLVFFVAVFYVTEGFFQWLVKKDISMIERTDLSKNGFYHFFFSFFITQMFILMGSFVFRKGAFLKTMLLLIGWFALSNELNNRMLGFVTGEKSINGGALFDYFQFVYAGENVYVHLPAGIDQGIGIFFNFIFPAVLYYVNYLKLKETEL
jgi:hypothetical protein